MLQRLELDSSSSSPLYRQLYHQLKVAIITGRVIPGEKLPPTRELAGSLGLNRTTVAAAYELLESEGLIRGHVGRGSFVESPPLSDRRLDWESLVPAEGVSPTAAAGGPVPLISFASSRPSELQFPLDEFRATCREVIDSTEAMHILQLGPASGYGPLRRYLLKEARSRGTAGPDDEILITSGCQQAFDLIQRVLASHGETVVIEDPIYPGLRNAFLRGGARVIGAPVGMDGVNLEALGRLLEKEHPRLMVLTPNFQNPTGTTLPVEARAAILAIARKSGVVVVENDLYGELRYRGAEIPAIKRLDHSGDTILLGSFSKIAFPGLRVGWAIGPRRFIARLTEAKEASDLHSDQLSQAVLLRFADSGRLEEHRKKTLAAGAQGLKAILAACDRGLPAGSEYTRPEGGMNVWVNLPEPMDASDLAVRAEREGVSYLPGRHFAVSRPQPQGLRLSFAGLSPEEIRAGLAILERIFAIEFDRLRHAPYDEPAPAMV